ncbi:MAG: OmpA/MotB family protein [Chloroflexota bacterium]
MIRAGRKAPKKENSERWLLTYADLITLLLAFFVLMYAMSTADVKKFARLAASMQKAFNVGVLEGQTEFAIVDQGGPTMTTIAQALAQEDFEFISREMATFAREEGLGDKIEVTMRREGIAISLSDRALFASGRAELGMQSKRTLSKVAEILKRVPNEVRVEGHTDDVPTNNPEYPTNWELSTARSLAVVRYFIDEAKIPPARFSVAGYSEYRPVADNNSPENRAKNRRCDILVIYAH